MQIRRSSFPSTHILPPCPFEHEPGDRPCLHGHGCYKRYASPEGNAKVKISRYLCKFNGKTISVLPDEFLPYRCVHVSRVEEDFDRRSDCSGSPAKPEGGEPKGCERVKSCLRRAWHRFADQSRHQSLAGFFGQRIALTSTAEELWKALRHAAGRLSGILLELASQGKSLFGDYRCLSPS